MSSADLRRALGRLDGLPIRPLTARAALATFAHAEVEPLAASALPKFVRSDPGWVLGVGVDGLLAESMAQVAARPWWRPQSEDSAEALERLWRHAVATSLAARRLAIEAGREDSGDLARAGLLHQLGLWAVASVAPDRLAEILAAGPETRRDREVAVLGKEASALGRDLAERWGCSAPVVDAAWLHAEQDADLTACAVDPEGLRIIRQAFLMAEQTPWAILGPPRPRLGPTDPSLRILIAEVQVRCAAGLFEADATAHEEALSRSHARLLIRHDHLRREFEASDRLLEAIAGHSPTDSPEAWADRAAQVWCETPGVTSARVEWEKSGIDGSAHSRGPAKIILRADPPSTLLDPSARKTLAAWRGFADLVADRDRQTKRLEAAVSAHRSRVDRDAVADRTSRLDALAEFAAGAGHELNNPLAVILGRAQLLLPVVETPEAARSLRIIIAQAQRAHRILRDLMFIGRPPQLRPRPCQPDEIVRACLRDLKDEADARGVRLVAEPLDAVPVAWADPDPLRHLADSLVRNALEATPPGGTVRFSTGKAGDRLSWTVKDTGDGISPEDGAHLFDPFFCGRQAGRGLGLGLPRVARFLSMAGGEPLVEVIAGERDGVLRVSADRSPVTPAG